MLSCGVALEAQPPAAPPPAEQTWMLTFPQFERDPDFQLVSAEFRQTTKPMIPPLDDLGGDPGLVPAIGMLTLVVGGGDDALVQFLAAHAGLKAQFWDMRTGDNILVAGCRMVLPLPADRQGSFLHTLRLTYQSIDFTQEEE